MQIKETFESFYIKNELFKIIKHPLTFYTHEGSNNLVDFEIDEELFDWNTIFLKLSKFNYPGGIIPDFEFLKQLTELSNQEFIKLFYKRDKVNYHLFSSLHGCKNAIYFENDVFTNHAMKRLKRFFEHCINEKIIELSKIPLIIEFENLKETESYSTKLDLTRKAYTIRDELLVKDFEKNKIFQIKKLQNYHNISEEKYIRLFKSNNEDEFYSYLILDELETLGW